MHLVGAGAVGTEAGFVGAVEEAVEGLLVDVAVAVEEVDAFEDPDAAGLEALELDRFRVVALGVLLDVDDEIGEDVAEALLAEFAGLAWVGTGGFTVTSTCEFANDDMCHKERVYSSRELETRDELSCPTRYEWEVS